ncbi:MAG: hypothetical protein KatS3mg130_1560 [Candidatus Sumerlaea sp.]|nr:MAG: hypothetical protein KatS3mg130_1560 [Candidatus Sumerlaea sp.]
MKIRVARHAKRTCRRSTGRKEQYALEFKLSNGGTVTMAELIDPPGATAGNKEGYLKAEPQCPSGGTYTVNPIGTDPTCSIGSSNAPFTPHIHALTG